MSERLEAEIIAKDSATPVFRKVADGAERLETEFRDLDRSLEETERTSRQTGRAVEELGRETEEAGRSAETYRNRLTAVGAGLGTLASGLALAGNAALNQRFEIEGLQRAYGDAGDEILAFTERIQQTTVFSNEAARESAMIASTLARNYGFTADEIEEVLQISADLATVTGFDLADATMRVTSALRGEAESAEMLGLTMNQAAIDHDNLTLSMGNQEAAQFRLNALREQAAFAEGAAADRAQELSGRVRQLVNDFQDWGVSVGQAAGPLGEVAAQMAPLALYLPVVSGALGRMTPAFTGAAGGARGLVTALGPAAGLVGAAGIAVAGLGALALALTRTVDATEDAEEAAQNYNEMLIRLGEQGALTAQQQQAATLIMAISEQLNEQASAVKANADEIEELAASFENFADQGSQAIENIPLEILERYEALMGEVADANRDGTLSAEEARAAAENLMTAHNEAAESAGEWGSATQDVNAILTAQGAAADEAREKLIGILIDLRDGIITEEQFAAAAAFLNEEMREQQAAATAAAEAVEELVSKYPKGAETAGQFAAALGLVNEQERLAGAFRDEAISAVQEESRQFDVSIQRLKERVAARQDDTDATEATTAEVEALSDAFRRADNDAQQLAFNIQRSMASAALSVQRNLGQLDRFTPEDTEARHELVVAFDDAAAEQAARVLEVQTRMVENQFAAVTTAATQANQTLGTGFRVIVQNTDAIAKQADSVKTWADELINVEGEYGKIDDLLISGRINLDQYTAAQQAYNTIAFESEQIQNAVLEIQAKQAPVLAELMEAQKQYIDDVAEMEGRQQLAALGFMDTTASAQALELALRGVELGGGAAFEQMVIGAAAADPVMAAMLEQMGLINIEVDELTGEKTITFNAEGFEAIESGTERLTEAITELTDTLHVIFFDSNAGDVRGEVDALNIILDSLPEEKTIELEGDGTGITQVLGSTEDQLDGLTPRTVFIHGDGTGVTQATRDVVNDLELVPWNPIVTIDGDEQDALDALGRAKRELELWDSSVGTATANLVDNASATLANISAHLNGLDGRSVTTYINTVQTFRGSSSSPLGGRQLGGVAGYDDGGMVRARLAEAGPELLQFPNGGMALAPHDGIYSVPHETFVHTAPATNQMLQGMTGGDTFNVTISIDGAGDPAQVADRVAAELVDAVRRRKRGMGW